MQKICSKCDEEFESERGKPGLGNVCPRCLETIRQEQGARQVAEAERRHKLLGLDITKHELSGPGGGPVCVTASSLDFSKLSEEQLRQLEDRARRGATVTFRPRQPPIGTASSGENQANSIYLQHGDESCSVRSDPTAAEAPISVFFFVRREA